MTEPPAKRDRKNSHQVSKPFWFDDGNVVLQAENTRFRVHWSLLCLHSSVFRGMRAFLNGCSRCALSCASSRTVTSYVRLGRKQDFKDLLSSAVKRLECLNPPEWHGYVEWGRISLDSHKDNQDYIIRSPPRHPHTGSRESYIVGPSLCLLSRRRRTQPSWSSLRRSFATHAQYLQRDILNGIPGPNNIISAADQQTLARSKLLKVQYEPGQAFGWIFRYSEMIGETNVTMKTARACDPTMFEI
ncbi:hypothetical protein C8F04DRAFT_1303474 [Mycena alexandri]|uniref:BTB domain-containing protein n=1 Tax=Mycena alexandri TaxID=1745969 RepID=A0AAD6RZU7_9AGAR|nr:hypothetical protein C8F04DRAFT_1243304 [Mycena alexandri]KAJ7024019.1 hypothetical protein C8F04DRAFT_1303474 [Mycena alexandri]